MEMTGPLTRLRYVVRGRVQGIGYRWFVRREAVNLGVTGWVRNRTDGAVELEAEGPMKALERFRVLLESGHPHARVEEIEEGARPPGNGPDSFEIR